MVMYRGLSVDATGIAQPRSRQKFTGFLYISEITIPTKVPYGKTRT